MSVMLEKALDAALAAIAASNEVGDNEMRSAIRAALQSIREPDEATFARAWNGPEPWDADALSVWQDLIDAVLNERSEPTP